MKNQITRRFAIRFGAAAAALAATDSASARTNRVRLSLGQIDAVETTRRVKSGEFTALQIVDAAIERAEKTNPQINALVYKTYDSARMRAAADPGGVFGGMPIAIKDLNDLDGAPTQSGSRAFKDAPAGPHTEFGDRLDNIGFIAIGKSATPEFGLTATTEPLLSGPCRNPWNLNHSTGGSSGGAAALVASGVLPLSHASDGGGSIRIPAATCGLVGLKTSRGRYIPEGAVPQDSRVDISVNGALTRTVRDTAAFAAALENPNSGLAPIGLVTGPNRRRLKIGYYVDALGGTAVDNEVKLATANAAALCRSLGHDVRPIKPRMDAKSFEEAFMLLWSAGAAQTVQGWANASKRQPDDSVFEPWTLFLAANFAANRARFPWALETLGKFSAEYANIMLPEIDVMISPVLSAPAPEIGYLSPAQEGAEHYRRVIKHAAFTAFHNVAGAPSLSLPLAMSQSRLPIGIQFAAHVGDEKTLLELAYELETASPWIGRKPIVWAG